jgi:hypothetical protein
MVGVHRWVLGVVLLAVLMPAPFCLAQSPCDCMHQPPPRRGLAGWWQRLKERFRRHPEPACADCQTLTVPPAALRPIPASQQGGMLLRTGSFQLGPNVNEDLLRSQGDGRGGFFNNR